MRAVLPSLDLALMSACYTVTVVLVRGTERCIVVQLL